MILFSLAILAAASFLGGVPAYLVGRWYLCQRNITVEGSVTDTFKAHAPPRLYWSMEALHWAIFAAAAGWTFWRIW